MNTREVCPPDCPNYEDAVGLRNSFEQKLSSHASRPLSEDEVVQKFAQINPLTSILFAPPYIANNCLKSSVRKVTIK